MIAETTDNGFLGGKLILRQPAKGYRAGIDPVLLAACVPAMAGQKVLELGCGVGTALFCLGARVAGLDLFGVDVQADYAELARRNAKANALEAQVFTGSLADLPDALRHQSFEHVLANPPYFPDVAHSKPADVGRNMGRIEALELSEWCRIGIKRLAPKGRYSMIMTAERLPEVLAGFSAGLGAIEVKPITARQGRAARLVLVQGVKGARGAFKLHSPLILHDGAQHEGDGDSYRANVAAILRKGAQLSFQD